MYRLLPILLLLFTSTATAWQVEIRTSDDPTALAGVWVGNQRNLERVDAYLVHADLDAPSSEWRSWGLTDGWRTGLHPVTGRPMNLAPFEARRLGEVESRCAADHRCILALVAVAAGDDPLDSSGWLASSIHPLNAAAARLRLPGQRLFLDPNGANRELVGTLADGSAAPPTAAPATDTASTTTEKPDIFRLEGSRLLYANGAAERFQVIDVSDPAAPFLVAWLPLQGPPREIYALNDHYVLMQGSQWGSDDGTRVTTLRLSADNQLERVDEFTLTDGFVESRRRDGVIYAVTQRHAYRYDSAGGDGTTAITVHALEIDTAGAISQSGEATFNGYAPEVAIFPDHLVITGHDTSDWRSTNVQLYHLARTDTPLHPLEPLQLPGRIPSEFHLNVTGDLLRLVYGPADRDTGSTLAIYTIGADTLAFSGASEPIAAGEDLFATRFVGDTAYVVTYERTDPLWVLDLSDATAPTIVGELEVPGWSELLFFNDQRLFAVGIDDQPAEGEDWARRVAVSLFDVSDPTLPTLINRLTPLAGEALYSHSPALDDERALLLDWGDGYAALPIVSWDNTTENRLQLVTIGSDGLSDAGYLSSTNAIERSLELDSDTLAALGNQNLITLSRGSGDPQTLGELELARNLTWITADGDQAWVAGSGDGGYHRLYRYGLDDLETPTAITDLSAGFYQATNDGGDLLFYNTHPLTVQRIEQGSASPLIELESGSSNDYYSWSARDVLLADGVIYLGESHYLPGEIITLDMVMPPAEEDDGLTTLRRWRIANGAAEELNEITIPGRAVAVTANGELLTLEGVGDTSTLHRLALDDTAATLLEGTPLPCRWPTTLWRAPDLYVSCAANFWVDPDATTTLIRYTTGGGLQESGRWQLEGSAHLREAGGGKALIHRYTYASPTPTPAPTALPTADAAVSTSLIAPYTPPYESFCEVLDLSGSEPTVIATPDDCGGDAALTDDRLLQARGYAGIRETRW